MFGFEIREEWEAEVARLLSTLTWPLAGRGRNGEWILLSCPGEGNLFTTLQSRLGGGLMSRCSPGPVAVQPRWAPAAPPHNPSCFPGEG